MYFKNLAIETVFNKLYDCILLFHFQMHHLSIESHFVGVHGRYELHRKEVLMRFNTYIYIFLQQSLSRYCLL